MVMGFQAVLTALLLIASALSVLSQASDSECLTPTKRKGFCVPIERCRNIYNIVNNSTNSPSRGVQNYINRAACTLPDVARSVCCKPEEIILASTPTTITTIADDVQINLRNRRLLIGTEPAFSTELNWNLLPTVDCGIITKPRIAHGNKTFPYEYPWIVLLMYQSLPENTLQNLCGGSLINERYVLTAAHCLKTSSFRKLVKVRLGEHDQNTPIDCIVYHGGKKDCAAPAFDVDIEETIIPKNYNRPNKFRNDIGLIRLAKKIERSDSVMPICLPVDESVRKNVLPKYIITGWGTTETQTTSQVLLQAYVNHVPIRECQRKMNAHFLAVQLAEPWQMCAIGDNEADSCSGDSGGPLGSSVAVSGLSRFVQFGIVSAGGHECGVETVPGIYTSVSAYMNWIVANIRP